LNTNTILLFSPCYHCFCLAHLPSSSHHISIHDYAMPPWTKQTCKKSTGGDAPHVTLNLPGAVSTILRVEVETVRIKEEERTDHNNITPCHQDIISEVSIKFVCISCHVLAQYHGCCHKSPYFGFYHDGKPIFDTFLQIYGALKLSHQAQVLAKTMLFIHLNLINNDVTGSPFKLAHDFLMPYFSNGGIIFCKITFDIGSDLKIIKFHSMVDKLILKLLVFPGGWKCIIFGISDHTKNTFGDPFVGYKGKKKIYIATPVNTLFCCGAIVNNSESFANLKTSVLKHQLSTVAFNAHSNILLLVKNSDLLNITKFTWTHTVFRPWGQYLPV
ncbi:hypothetical protein BDR06DRAFT_1036130, partial [Suillus hirtellus]